MKIKSLLIRYKELLLYGVFGVLTTLINMLVYFLCRQFGMGVVPADVVAWVMAVAFAYITNKLFVFESKSFEGRLLLREIGEFVTARLASLLVDVAILYVTVQLLNWWELPMKIAANVIVIVMNYIFSKWIIFRKDTADKREG